MPAHNAKNSRKNTPRERFHGRVKDSDQGCYWAGCKEAGEFKAPRMDDARDEHGEKLWQWFCLDHVREFNANFNYFAGMTMDEIHEAQHEMTHGWHRESPAFNATAGVKTPRWTDFDDPLDAIGAKFKGGVEERIRARKAAHNPLSREDRQALKTLGVDGNAGRKDIRRAYLRLVRSYHPDQNGGNRSHEHALGRVIAAWKHLEKHPLFNDENRR